MNSSKLIKTPNLQQFLPILNWIGTYGGKELSGDLIAAAIVTIMLVPQSLAYAMLAGLPAEVGLYASILPLVAYAILGTSRTLAVGPVAVASLMTATALAPLGLSSVAEYMSAAAMLALLSGGFMLAMGFLKFGALANLLSHPVVAGFISASGLLIAASQLKHILGVSVSGHTLPEIVADIVDQLGSINLPTIILGAVVIALLYWMRTGLAGALVRLTKIPVTTAGTVARVGPVFAVIATILVAWALNLPERGVAIVGDVPSGLPPFGWPLVDFDMVTQLIGPAILISVIGYVESISVAQTLAAKRKQRIEPNQELVALGASNISAGLSGGYPVTGGFARSVVNFDAGAQTPAAGAFTAIGLLIAALALTPFLYFLPKATLAATIIVAVLSLVDLSILRHAWEYSKADFAAVLTTISVTLLVGVEIGVASGVAVSILLFLWKTTRPHIAEVGQVPDSQHFRNVQRHNVITDPSILTLRIDESLYFANARRMEDIILARVHQGRGKLRHVILMCSAVNEIDLSALESLEVINDRLCDLDVQLHLSEVKGPVMDRLHHSALFEHLSGNVYLSQFDAFNELVAVDD
ncbi:MAG: SulP family inorganic anion transporter [Hyphomicrobiales bacterium]